MGWEGGGTYQSKWFRSGCGGLWPYNGEFVGTGLQIPFLFVPAAFESSFLLRPLRVCGTIHTIAEAQIVAVVVPVVRSSLLLPQGSQLRPLLFVFLVVVAATASRLTSGCLPACCCAAVVCPRLPSFLVWCGLPQLAQQLPVCLFLSLRLVASCSSLASFVAPFFSLFLVFLCLLEAFYLAVFDLAGTECVCVFSMCFFVAFWRSGNGRTQRSGRGCVLMVVVSSRTRCVRALLRNRRGIVLVGVTHVL